MVSKPVCIKKKVCVWCVHTIFFHINLCATKGVCSRKYIYIIIIYKIYYFNRNYNLSVYFYHRTNRNIYIYYLYTVCVLRITGSRFKRFFLTAS